MKIKTIEWTPGKWWVVEVTGMLEESYMPLTGPFRSRAEAKPAEKHANVLRLSQHRMIGSIGVLSVRAKSLQSRVRDNACLHTPDVNRALDKAHAALGQLSDAIREAQERERNRYETD
jgi:hypothetical protein